MISDLAIAGLAIGAIGLFVICLAFAFKDMCGGADMAKGIMEVIVGISGLVIGGILMLIGIVLAIAGFLR